MKTSLIPWLVAAFVTLAASTLTYRPELQLPIQANAAAPPGAQEPDSVQARSSNGHDAWALLWKFVEGPPFGDSAERRPQSSYRWAAHDAAESRAFLHEHLAGYDTDFIIATVADPIESHAQDDFDRSMHAIEAALGAIGYSLSRFDLPWKTPSHQQVEGAEERALPNATFRPGVMLFFKAGEGGHRPQLLLVFAVGETPNAGIHKAAFFNAVRQANDVCQVANCPRRAGNGAMRILGPTFSGSMQSLQTALDDYLKPNRDTVVMISGSATATELAPSSERETFETTVHNDRETLDAVYRYLHDHCRAQAREFGILYEEGTGYGTASKELLQEDVRHKCPRCDPRRIAKIPFPFGISELSAESARNDAADLTRLQAGERTATVLTPENAGHDIIPVFSSLKQADADRALSALLATIQQLNLKYVGILATNVRDTIFLAQQIRTHTPNIVVFVLDNDSLYLNGEVVHDLRGMLVASTYPLFPDSEIFSADHETQFIFSSQQQEDTYNALLALLKNDSAMLDYYTPQPASNRRPQPPVWLTVVGSTQVWPVGIIETPGFGLHRAGGAPPQIRPRVLNDGLQPRVLKLILLFIGAVSIYAAAIRLFRRFGYLALPSSAMREVIAPFQRAQNYYLFALFMILAILFSLVCLTFVLPVSALPGYFHFSWWIRPWMLLVYAFLIAAIMFHGYAVINRFNPGRDLDEHFAAIIATVLPLFWLVLLFWFGWAEAATAEGSIFWLAPAAALRFANVGSGISTFRPLFLIGMAALSVAYGALRRLRLGEQLFANIGPDGAPCFLGFESPSFSRLRVCEEQISRLISTVSLGGPRGRPLTAMLFVMAFVVVWWLFRPLGNAPFGWPFVYSFEASQFNWLFIIAFLAVYLEIAHSAMRCALCWRGFKAFLHRLSHSPLVEDFAYVGRAASTDQNPTPRLQLSMPEATFTSLYFSVEAADQLAQCGALAAPIRREAQSLKTQFDGAVRGGREGAFSLIRSMARLSGEICAGLEPFSPMRLPESPACAEQQAALRCRYFLATRVVHYCWIMLVEFRNWLIFTAAGLFLMLMAVSSYPFINEDALLRFSWVALLAGISLAVTLMVQINRDKVLSLLSGGTPGKIDWNWEFMSRLLIYGVLPILALLGIQFPATLSGLSHLIQTVLGGASGLK